ncbi:helix-turn-helix domain-containing protein [Streptomyces sp. p1417]|uniref:Helix-turn-helix domain-containing protein n=1 Tax=Streptomyces typhae TaxID=2681492 RepID=A0A6L6X260_9ACTN|nr:helix-turn-helix transcriptional regulator [Streptomyces typhae]MVO87892.1 helix-turn-helix domain-containing protein [Streptomyces typhae]
MTTQDFVRLGAELKEARERMRPRVSQPGAAEALGVSRSTIQKIENGNAAQVFVTTVRAYVRFVGWTDDSYERVLAGGDPTPVDGGQQTSVEQAASDLLEEEASPRAGLGLSPTVEYELRSSETLESTVINLGPDEDDGHIIVVLQGKKGATPEEVQRVAERYRRVRRHLQVVATDADEVADL